MNTSLDVAFAERFVQQTRAVLDPACHAWHVEAEREARRIGRLRLTAWRRPALCADLRQWAAAGAGARR